VSTDAPFRCICDPDDIFDPPDPRPVAVEGCPAHQARYAAQQFELRLTTTETRTCDNECEPDGERCTGMLTFAPDDVQAKCPTCGGWTGRFAPRRAVQLAPIPTTRRTP
jgi:hypothetical protein